MVLVKSVLFAVQVRWLLEDQPHAVRYCVGDPAQRIYSFRGAGPRALPRLRAAGLFRRTFRLTGSFR